MFEFQRDARRIVLHQVFAWLTKILVTKNGQDEDQNRRHHHGLRGGAAHALRSARGPQPVIAAHQRDGEREHEWLEQPLRHVVPLQDCHTVAQYWAPSRFSTNLAMINPPNMPTKSAMMVSSGSDHGSRDHARRHQLLNRIGSQGAHGVDLLGHLHGSQLARDTGRVAAGHHQRRQHQVPARAPA